MDEIKAESILEGLLFSMGDAVSVGRLAEALGEDKKTTRQYLAHMQEKYEQEGRGIHLVWFEDSVQLCTKTELYEYLIRLRLDHAKTLLENTSLSIRTIGEISGFQDEAYFSRLFRRRTGVSALKYRQEKRKSLLF